MKYGQKDRRTDVITKAIGLITIALFLVIILAKGFYLYDLLPTIIASVACIFVLVSVVPLFKYNSYVSNVTNSILSHISTLSYSKMLAIIIGVSLISKILAIVFFQINSIDSHPDINVYVNTSNEFVEFGYAQKYAGYCYTFSHMYWFAAFLTPVTALFGVSQIAYSIYLTLILTIVAILLFDLISFISTKGKGFIIIILYLILPSQILLPQYVTHEIASLLFLCLFLWFYFKVYKLAQTKLTKTCAFGASLICVFFCSALNALGIVAVIAVFLIFILEYVRNTNKITIFKSIAKSVCLILIFILGTVLLGEVQLQHSQLDTSEVSNNKVLWTLYVGSNYESKGEWFADDKWHNYPLDFSSEEINAYHKNLIFDHYKELFSPPVKILNHLKNKITTIWGDFSYSLGFSNETISNENFRQVYNRFLYKPLTLLNYGLLLLIAIWGLCRLVKNRKEHKSLFFVFCELYLLGTTAVLLLSECNNKYTISIIPVFIIVSLSSRHKSSEKILGEKSEKLY